MEITRQHYTTCLAEILGWTCRSLTAIGNRGGDRDSSSVSILVVIFDEAKTPYRFFLDMAALFWDPERLDDDRIEELLSEGESLCDVAAQFGLIGSRVVRASMENCVLSMQFAGRGELRLSYRWEDENTEMSFHPGEPAV